MDDIFEMKYISVALMAFLTFILGSTVSTRDALAFQSISLDSAIENFTQNLGSQIRELVTETMQRANNSLGSTISIVNGPDTNATNIVSSQSVVSNNISLSSKAGGDASSVSTSQITNVNGVCTSNITGGMGSETLSSKGVCNDQLTGGAGADNFVCGEGNDVLETIMLRKEICS